MTDYSKITALYSRLSVGDEDRDGGESNSIQNQKIFLENYARGQHLTNIRHYIDDDESGRFFDRSAYSRMMAVSYTHLDVYKRQKQEIRRILERGGKIDRTVEYAVDDEDEEYEQYHGFSMRM